MRVWPPLKDELGEYAPLDRYELVAKLADGCFGYNVIGLDRKVFFISNGKIMAEDVASEHEPRKIRDAMENLIGKIFREHGISPNEVEMRLALKGELQ